MAPPPARGLPPMTGLSDSENPRQYPGHISAWLPAVVKACHELRLPYFSLWGSRESQWTAKSGQDSEVGYRGKPWCYETGPQVPQPPSCVLMGSLWDPLFSKNLHIPGQHLLGLQPESGWKHPPQRAQEVREVGGPSACELSRHSSEKTLRYTLWSERPGFESQTQNPSALGQNA